MSLKKTLQQAQEKRQVPNHQISRRKMKIRIKDFTVLLGMTKTKIFISSNLLMKKESQSWELKNKFLNKQVKILKLLSLKIFTFSR